MDLRRAANSHGRDGMFGKRQILRYLFDRYFSWRLNELTDGKLMPLEYKFDAHPRYGYGYPPHPELTAIFEAARPTFSSVIDSINKQADALFRIEQRGEPALGEPTFDNVYCLGLDAAALYAILATEKPQRYVEVGSGHSTTFARRAIRDQGLATKIISIDPYPRAEIEALCDEAFRTPLEKMPLDLFYELGPGDMLFIDNSHRCFMNTDVTVFFLEVLPRLKPGLVLHVHDIFLPYDYPPEWSERYYSEQYLLACWLMAQPGHLDLLFSSAFVSLDLPLSTRLSPFWDDPRFRDAKRKTEKTIGQYKGAALWARVGERTARASCSTAYKSADGVVPQ